MECRFCQKAFHKGEHVRRHERSHTGVKPYVCKKCNRSFSRQDSLIRHEKLHTRPTTEILTPDEASASGTAPIRSEREVTAANPSPYDSGVAPIFSSPPRSSLSGNEHHRVSTPAQNNGSEETQTHPISSQDMLHSAELDFELIWPDSADLYETLVSQDISMQWQMPLGTLPFSTDIPLPSDNLTTSSTSYPTPTSLDERVSSIGSIPCGGNDQALKDVRKMVASSSSSINAAIDGTSINSVFVSLLLSCKVFWLDKIAFPLSPCKTPVPSGLLQAKMRAPIIYPRGAVR